PPVFAVRGRCSCVIRLYSPHLLQQRPARRRGHRQWLAETASRQMAASLYGVAAIRDCQIAGSNTDLRLVHGHSQPTSGVFVRAAGLRQEIPSFFAGLAVSTTSCPLTTTSPVLP